MKEQTRWTPKRLLSLLLALVMLLGMMPTAVFAEDVGNDEIYYFDPTIIRPQTITFNYQKVNVQPMGVDVPQDIAAGLISDSTDTGWKLSFSIDEGAVDKPRDMIGATVSATITGSNQEGATITEVSVTDRKNNGSAWTASTNEVSTGKLKVDRDGCARFQVTLKYDVAGTVYTKSADVVIMSLWTGYNVTYSKPAGAIFTGSIAAKNGKDKTRPRNAEKGDYSQVYTIPTDARAEQDGYTFETWRIEVSTSDSDIVTSVQPGVGYFDIVDDVTLTAELYENQKITFVGVYSGVTGIPNEVQYSQGRKYKIEVQDPKLDGYQFDGWLVEGSNIVYNYKKGETVYGITGPTRLIAQWTPDDGSAPVGSHKVTFLAGAANVYIPFASTTALVEDGKDYTIPPAEPTREGYLFNGWKSGTKTYRPGDQLKNVTDDMTLEAQWTRETVAVTYQDLDSTDGVSYAKKSATNPEKGSDVSFRLKLESGYDPATLHVYANGVELAAEKVKGGSDYQYTFKANANTDITVGAPSKLTYTVTLPIGERFDTAFTAATDTTTGLENLKNVTVAHGGSVSFTVTPREGWTLKNVYDNGTLMNATSGTYTISNIQADHQITVDVE